MTRPKTAKSLNFASLFLGRILCVCGAVALALRLLASGGIAAGEVSSSLTAQEQLKLATDRLPRGYPGIVKSVENGEVIFGDGARLPLGVGNRPKSFQQWLSHPDILDMFALEYPESSLTAPPPANFDPGRARNAAFFKKVYGDCAKGAVAATLVAVNWLPKKAGQMLKVTSINGVARQLEAVSAELDALPADFDVFLYPAAGTYNCRDIAGTTTPSAHGYGIAIDIAVQRASYWRWSGAKGDTAPAWRNEVPMEIVRVFEKHGFIWGGKWNHFDTMHFEYRPELLPPSEGPALRSGAQK
ncbi:MAG: M15 family metallopeptidase [Hyphomicrobium sp.]